MVSEMQKQSPVQISKAHLKVGFVLAWKLKTFRKENKKKKHKKKIPNDFLMK